MKKFTLLLVMTLAFVNMAKADVEWTIWEGSVTGGNAQGASKLDFSTLEVGDIIYVYGSGTLSKAIYRISGDDWDTWTALQSYSPAVDDGGNYYHVITADFLTNFNYSSNDTKSWAVGNWDTGTITKVTIRKGKSMIKTTLSSDSKTTNDTFEYTISNTTFTNMVAGDFLRLPASKRDEADGKKYKVEFKESEGDWTTYTTLWGPTHDAIWQVGSSTIDDGIKDHSLYVYGELYNTSGVYMYHPINSFSIGSIGYATFSAAQQVTAPASVTAYKGAISGDKLVLTPFTNNVIPANTGAIIAGTQGAILEFTASSAETSESSELHANTAATSVSSLTEEGYDLYVLYPGAAESETDLSLSTLLDNWGSWHDNIATWTSGTNTITFDATKSTLYNTSTVMGDWTTIDQETLTPSLFSSIEAGDKIVVTASASDGGQVWIAKMTGDGWTEENLIDGESISTKVSYTLTADDIDVIKERGIRLKGKNFTLATVEIERASGDGEGGWLNKDWSDYDYLQLNFSSNTLDADATFYVAYYEHDGNTTEATLSQGSTSVRIPLDATYKNCNGNFSMYSHATSGSLTFESAALIDNDGATVAEFRKTTSGELAANKAYLKIPTGEGARALNIVFDDEQETTAIESVAPKAVPTDNVYYNLRGQRVTQPTKGLYIVNGKKVVIK